MLVRKKARTKMMAVQKLMWTNGLGSADDAAGVRLTSCRRVTGAEDSKRVAVADTKRHKCPPLLNLDR